MVDAHSSPAFADQRRISVDGHQPGLPAQEKPGLRDLPFPGHLLVPGYRCRSVRIEAVVPDLVELPVRDVDEEPCDEAGDAVRDILPAAFPAFLEPVVLVRIVVPGHRPGLLVEAVDSPSLIGGWEAYLATYLASIAKSVRRYAFLLGP